MSIWVTEHTKVLVQGITGSAAKLHTRQMLDYGTKIVGGITPGKDGQEVEGVPVYGSVQKAVDATHADTSVIYVPAPFAADAIIEAADAGITLILCITEHIPVQDMIMVSHYLKSRPVRLIGPNCPGIITPDVCKIGIMPGHIHQSGRIGVVSRSGTLTYEAVHALTTAGYGQSTAVGIGGDPISGTNFIDVLESFEKDSQTDAIIMIGEIGGDAEENAARWAQQHMTKPIIGFVSGITAPPGKRMGHAGAIVSGSSGTAESKIIEMERYGIRVARRISEIVPLLKQAL